MTAGATSRSRPVAITAMGLCCALGDDLDDARDALRVGRTAIGSVRGWRATELPCALAAEVPEPVADLEGFPDDRKVALLSRAAAPMCAGRDGVAPERVGVFLGTGLASVSPRHVEQDIYPRAVGGRLDWSLRPGDLSPDHVSPRRGRPERATIALAERLGARGVVATSFSACAASAEAIASGVRAIARGEADRVVAGGHDAMIHPLGALSFEALGALGRRPARPLDRHRDGFTLGEGAALLCLEPPDRATDPVAFVLGSGSSCDAWGITAPHAQGEGAERAMRAALHDAGLAPQDIDWVKAHATGTPLGDAAEARAIARVFGSATPVSSLKGAIGHTLAASGAIEVVLAILSMRAGFIPGTVGCVEPDDLGVDTLCSTSPRSPVRVLCNSFGFGGQNVSLVLALELR